MKTKQSNKQTGLPPSSSSVLLAQLMEKQAELADRLDHATEHLRCSRNEVARKRHWLQQNIADERNDREHVQYLQAQCKGINRTIAKLERWMRANAELRRGGDKNNV